MNTRQTLYRLSAVAFVALAGSVAAVACSSNNNSTPNSGTDAGEDGTASTSSSSGGSSGGSGGSSSGAACTPDGGANAPCNSCAAGITIDGGDPYNACSPYTVNCIKFDNSHLPDAARL